MIKLKRTGARLVEIKEEDFWNAVGREVDRHFNETRAELVLTITSGQLETEYRVVPNAHKNNNNKTEN